MNNILSIDVEEYFHPTEVQRSMDMKSWENLPSRVEPVMLSLLEEMAKAGVTATCFILGWVARRNPKLVATIADAGHEIACHSFAHQLVFELTPALFREDTRQAIAAIEDACGITPRLYRAPSYSITKQSWWALEILAELGFTHDSSIYPIRHDRYGIPGFPRTPVTISTPSGTLVEVPIATVELAPGRVAPVGGGAYLRLLPYRYTAAGIRRLNNMEVLPACLYVHPWEFDPEQPRLTQNWISGLRTYGGVSTMRGKFTRLLQDFRFLPLGDVYPQAAGLPAFA